ncbi:hypothetical protein TNCV_4832641 [Trichonephila clavipes]|nr:hypothetical protein TNCV_4832641 [Trichonephila clavipes]
MCESLTTGVASSEWSPVSKLLRSPLLEKENQLVGRVLRRHDCGSDTLPRTQAFEWYWRFREGRESVKDEERSGHPQTSRNAENIEKFSAVVSKNRLQRMAGVKTKTTVLPRPPYSP